MSSYKGEKVCHTIPVDPWTHCRKSNLKQIFVGDVTRKFSDSTLKDTLPTRPCHEDWTLPSAVCICSSFWLLRREMRDATKLGRRCQNDLHFMKREGEREGGGVGDDGKYGNV